MPKPLLKSPAIEFKAGKFRFYISHLTAFLVVLAVLMVTTMVTIASVATGNAWPTTAAILAMSFLVKRTFSMSEAMMLRHSDFDAWSEPSQLDSVSIAPEMIDPEIQSRQPQRPRDSHLSYSHWQSST